MSLCQILFLSLLLTVQWVKLVTAPAGGSLSEHCNRGEDHGRLQSCGHDSKWQTQCTVSWNSNRNAQEICRRITVTTTTTETVSRVSTVHVTATRTPIVHVTTVRENVTTTSTETLVTTQIETLTLTPNKEYITVTQSRGPTCITAATYPTARTNTASAIVPTPTPSTASIVTGPLITNDSLKSGVSIPAYVLGAITGILLLILVVVVIGWMVTCRKNYKKRPSNLISNERSISYRKATTPDRVFDNPIYDSDQPNTPNQSQLQSPEAEYSALSTTQTASNGTTAALQEGTRSILEQLEVGHYETCETFGEPDSAGYQDAGEGTDTQTVVYDAPITKKEEGKEEKEEYCKLNH